MMAAGATALETLRIQDAADPRIDAYRNIRERDLVGRRGLFIAEGSVVLRALAASNHFQIESALILENRVAGLRDVLEKLPAATPVYVADGHCFDTIAGFPMHRGVLAVGRRAESDSVSKILGSVKIHAMVVVCIGISNHDNMGAIFRNAAAFGADAVFYDSTCCDPLYRKSIRVSVGAVLKVPFASFDDIDNLIDELTRLNFLQVALSPSGREDLRNIRRAQRTAIFLGAEGPGLPPGLIDRLTGARIEMAADFDSLNVAAASAIALHSLKA